MPADDSTPKYAVLKWADWLEIKKEIEVEENPEWHGVEALLLQDAEVIRKQDLTAAPVFFLYSNIIYAFIDQARATTDPAQWIEPTVLYEAAEHFHNAGLDAAQWPGRRLPT